MTRSGAAGVLGLALLAALLPVEAGVREGHARAARSSRIAVVGVELIPPAGEDTLISVTPTFTIRALDPRAGDRPIVLGLQVATTPGFNVPLLADTTVTGDVAVVTVARPLPPETRVYIRATARTATGEIVVSPVIDRVLPAWLTLISPNDPNGVTLPTPRPRFVWRSAPIVGPAAPWVYDLEIRNVGSGQSIFYANLTDTTFTPTVALDVNTSYRWTVTARHGLGESITVRSRSSFVIVNSAVPLVTLLYQNFPNPFPTATSSSTCVWFDLPSPAIVRLDIFDLSGRHVRNIIPGPSGIAEYPAGRHGRVSSGPAAAGCNGDIQWDGRGDDGQVVAAGVYLLRMRAGRTESVKKIVFRGRP